MFPPAGFPCPCARGYHFFASPMFHNHTLQLFDDTTSAGVRCGTVRVPFLTPFPSLCFFPLPRPPRCSLCTHTPPPGRHSRARHTPPPPPVPSARPIRHSRTHHTPPPPPVPSAGPAHHPQACPGAPARSRTEARGRPERTRPRCAEPTIAVSPAAAAQAAGEGPAGSVPDSSSSGGSSRSSRRRLLRHRPPRDTTPWGLARDA